MQMRPRRMDLMEFKYEPPSGYCDGENMTCRAEDPIDQELGKTIESDGCTNAQIQAQQVALDKWTRALGEAFEQLPESGPKDPLPGSVWWAWQKFVALEFERIEALYGALQ